MKSRIRMGLGVAAALALALPGTWSASAAQTDQGFTCSDGSTIVVRVPTAPSNQNGGWGAGQLVDGGTGHLIPTSFAFTLVDDTTGMTLFSQAQDKGGTNGNHTQPTVSCSSTDSATAGEFFGPQLPPGVSPDDTVSFTLSVVAVPKT
jgi:hypothetical protein